MAKPILVIRIHQDASPHFDKISKSLRKQMKDEYHVLIVGEDIDKVKFETFNVDKEEPITYAKLKKLINKEIEA